MGPPVPRTARRRLARWSAAALAAALAVAGCATDDIVVSEAALTDSPDARVVGWTADEAPRQVFSPEDEEVTLRVLFEFNYRGVYEWYKIEWIAPDGSPYKVVTLRTDFASHRDIQASLAIRGKMASRMPGVWRARLWLRGRDGAPDRLLVSRLFRIARPTEAMLAVGLTPVDPPADTARRPLAAAPVPPGTPEPAGAPATVSADTRAGAAAKSPVPAAPAGNASAPTSAPGAAGPQVLPPLALVAARNLVLPPETGTPPADAAAAASRPAGDGAASVRVVPPLAVEGGVVGVTLRATPSDGHTPLKPAFRHDFAGCPPLYYPPGPGCVEQAPEE